MRKLLAPLYFQQEVSTVRGFSQYSARRLASVVLAKPSASRATAPKPQKGPSPLPPFYMGSTGTRRSNAPVPTRGGFPSTMRAEGDSSWSVASLTAAAVKNVACAASEAE